MDPVANDVDADGTRLRLWERSATDPDRAVLFVHGATYPSRAIFAPRDAPEFSWLRAVAADGGAAFALDVRGYGDSERPAALDGDPDDAEPAVRAAVAAEDLRAALSAVRDRVDCPVHLVGTSWGTMIAGRLLAETPGVASATLHAPVYRPARELVAGFDLGAPPRAYRTLSRADVQHRWDRQLGAGPAPFRGGSGDEDPVFDAFWRTLVESGQGRDGERIAAPNGCLLDLRDAADGDPGYDPAAVDTPTLVIRGSADPTSTRADATALYDELTVPDREYVEIAGGTHFVHLEERRHALYDIVAAFQERH